MLPLEYRRKQPRQLARLAQENVKITEDALFTDLRKLRYEAAAEVASIIRSALAAALVHLEEWAVPTKPKVEGFMSSWDATIYPVPKGVL